jgi:hypothetical protein
VCWRLAHELLFVIAAIVSWGHFVGAFMVVVVNVDTVMDAGISADVTDVTVPS